MTKRLLSLAVITRTLLAGSTLDVKNGKAGQKPVTIDIPRRHLFTPISETERKDLLKLNAARELKWNEDPENFPVFDGEEAVYAARDAENEISQQKTLQQQAEQANRDAADRRIREAAQRQRLAEQRAASDAAAALAQQELDNKRTADAQEETEEDRQRKADIAARFAAASGDTDPLVVQQPDGTEGEADNETDVAHEEAENEELEEQGGEPAKDPEPVKPETEVKETPKATAKKATSSKKTTSAKKTDAADDDDSVV